MFLLIELLLALSIVARSRDIEWFKQTQYHNDNIIKIENSWKICHHPRYTLDSIQIFNFTALCVSLNVPLDWDDQQLNKTINYTVSRVYALDNIENTAGNDAFWFIPGI